MNDCHLLEQSMLLCQNAILHTRLIDSIIYRPVKRSLNQTWAYYVNLLNLLLQMRLAKKKLSERYRGVQYVHWVMHKCITAKIGGGKRNTHKVCKKQVNFSKTGGNLVKVGGNNNFRETGGKCT